MGLKKYINKAERNNARRLPTSKTNTRKKFLLNFISFRDGPEKDVETRQR